MSRKLDIIMYRMQRVKTSALNQDVRDDDQGLHTVFDLSLVGLGVVFPISVFVLAGHVVKDVAGPSAVISVIFAALAAGLSGLSYSELRARVRRLQASAYEYTYRVVGESSAFLIGWLLLLHHIMCTSASARAISQNINYLLDGRISNYTISHVGDIPGLHSYLDFVAFFLTLLTMIATVMDLTLDQRRVKIATLGCTVVVLLFILVVGLYHLNFHQWQTASKFFPKGIGGVLGGATVLTYSFWGSESILRSCDLGTRGLRRPAMASIMCVHIITMIVLILTVSAISLLASTWESDSPFVEGYTTAGISWARYIICPVAILVLVVVLLHHYRHSVTSLCELAADGLLPGAFSDRSQRTETPILAIITVGITASLCALILTVSDIVQVLATPIVILQMMTCIFTLCFHYKPEDTETLQKRRKRRTKSTSVAQSNGGILPDGSSYGATVPRGETLDDHSANNRTNQFDQMLGQPSPVTSSSTNNNNINDDSSDTDIDDIVEEYHHERCVRHLTENISPAEYRKRSTVTSFKRTRVALAVLLASSVIMSLIVSKFGTDFSSHNAGVIVLFVLALAAILVTVAVIAKQPRDSIEPYTVMMYVHHVPFTPLVALVMNIMMCSGISGYPALCVLIWIIIGCVVYVAYGMSHSHEAVNLESYPDEHRGLIVTHSATQSQSVTHEGQITVTGVADVLVDSDVYRTDRDDDRLIDCS